ncbi:MAG: hypothetical protein AB1505_30040 [Candidatus Latescibacterota bacterium]
MSEVIRQQSEALRPYLGSLERRAFLVGVVGLVGAAGGLLSDPEQFYRSYLLAFVYWTSLTLGSLVILMIHQVGGGTWGFAIRRLLEAGTRTLPLVFLLSLPILFGGIHHLYEWSHPEAVAHDALLQHKQPYLNPPFFVARTLAYFAVWGTLVLLLNRWSWEQDETQQTHPTHRLQVLSGPGIVLYALTMTLAALDWVMSLEPHWYSTIYGIILMVGQGLLAYAFTTVVAVLLARRQPLDRILTNQRLGDLGTYMLACVLLWAYVSFSQLLITWAGNLPEEITWYMKRLEGGWLLVGLLLVAFHFALPLVLLVSSRIKARTAVLVAVAGGLLVMRLVDLFWITAPAFASVDGYHSSGFRLHWLDVLLPVGMGGMWVGLFFGQLKTRPLLPLNDPRFAGALSPEAGHA